jgi:diguanylate cyclase (GGDEF)-like protein
MNRDVLRSEPDAPLADVVAQMNSNSQSAVVVCEEETPVGVITERDVVAVLDLCLQGHSFSAVQAADVMAHPVHTLPETSTMIEVIRVMNERRFRRVPIVDDKNQLTGIVNLLELQEAMNFALERRGRDLEAAVMERTAELQAANAQLEELSISDGLTGLLNRRAMTKKLEELHALSGRYGNAYSVILLDIDHFKNYNDSLGHLKGDDAIRALAKLLESTVRVLDNVYRYGGEEFLIIMPETDELNVSYAAERIRSETEAVGIPHPASSAADVLTVSIGHASVTRRTLDSFESWRDVIDEADKALYRAKAAGRNRVDGPI